MAVEGLKQRGVNDEIIQNLNIKAKLEFSQADENGDGKLSKEEYVKIFIKGLVEAAEAGFHAMDINKDGELDEAEVDAGIQLIREKLEGQMASEQIDAFVIRYKEEMKKADVNGDGKISFAEFMAKVQKEMDDLKTASGI